MTGGPFRVIEGGRTDDPTPGLLIVGASACIGEKSRNRRSAAAAARRWFDRILRGRARLRSATAQERGQRERAR